VFLDIDGASADNASFGSMKAVSGEHGVVRTLHRWIVAMLCCQSVPVEIRENAHREEYCLLCYETWWWTLYFVGSIMHIIRSRATLIMWFCCKKASS
jgi:hypothetical protein